MAGSSITIEAKSYGNADAVLTALSGQWLGNKCLRQAMGAAARVVVDRAKQLCPPPGYKGDKPNLKPLRDTIGWVFREYTAARVAVIGPLAPAGAHGHLVEHGHTIVAGGRVAREWEARLDATPADQLSPRQKRALAGWQGRGGKRPATGRIAQRVKSGKSRTEAKPFMGPAAEQTKQRQIEQFEQTLKQAIRRLAAGTEAT